MQTNTQKYSLNVRMGNWVEETRLQSDKIELFLARRSRGELLVQKSRKIYANLLRPVSLSTNEFLKYGIDVQIVCPDVRFLDSCTSGVSLSCSVPNDYHSEQDGLSAGNTMTASPFTEPCVRNCFKIRGYGSDCEDGKRLKFGDTFTISPCVSSRPLFVTAAVPRLCAERGASGHSPLRLANGPPDASCRWTATYWDAALQMEADGLLIPNGTRIMLKHVATNQNLAVENGYTLSTIFGKEYDVSAHSYKDSKGQDKTQNIWQFICSRSKLDEDDNDDDDDNKRITEK